MLWHLCGQKCPRSSCVKWVIISRKLQLSESLWNTKKIFKRSENWLTNANSTKRIWNRHATNFSRWSKKILNAPGLTVYCRKSIIWWAKKQKTRTTKSRFLTKASNAEKQASRLMKIRSNRISGWRSITVFTGRKKAWCKALRWFRRSKKRLKKL